MTQNPVPTDGSLTISQVHLTPLDVSTIELTPPHDPRVETPEYQQAHRHLTIELDTPCKVCGVRNSTLKDPQKNPFHAQAIESHHFPVERSLVDACDPAKVGLVYPQVKDRATLNTFVDSEANLIVLCDVHHRSIQFGIHHLATQDFFIQQFLYTGYQVVATKADVAQVQAQDKVIVAAAAQVTTQEGATVGVEAQVTMQGGAVVGAQAEVTGQSGEVASATAEVTTQGGSITGAQAQVTTQEGTSVEAQVTNPNEPPVGDD